MFLTTPGCHAPVQTVGPLDQPRNRRKDTKGERVGDSRVLLELLLRAFLRGKSPEGIVRSFRTLRLADVYAVITRYLANPAPFDQYLRQCDDDADAVRRKIEASQRPGPTKEELLARARVKGLVR